MKRTKFTVWIAVAAVAFSSVSWQASAKSLQQEKQLVAYLQQESIKTTQDIAIKKAKSVSLQSRLLQSEQSLQTLRQAMRSNLTQTRTALQSVHTVERQITANEKQLETAKRHLQEQMKVIYESGGQSELSVLMQARSWSDFVGRVYMLVTIAKADHQLSEQISALRSSLLAKKHSVIVLYRGLVHRHAEYVVLRQADVVVQEQQQLQLHDLALHLQADSAKQGMLESQIHLTNQQISQIEAETQQAETLVKDPTYIAMEQKSMQSVSGTSLIKYAEIFLGTPYVWGGTAPSGFDCSGFTQYVFEHFGINLSRTSEEQFAEGISVPSNQLSMGDLVFFSTYGPGATHVGIYIGNGTMIDAQDNGVSIDHVFGYYWGVRYIGARQIVHTTP